MNGWLFRTGKALTDFQEDSSESVRRAGTQRIVCPQFRLDLFRCLPVGTSLLFVSRLWDTVYTLRIFRQQQNQQNENERNGRKVHGKEKIGTLAVSEIGMGCMGFSHGYGLIPEKEQSIERIRKGFDAGCTFFDTAEVYGWQQQYAGHNEELVGEALKDVRDQAVVATKITINTEELAEGRSLETIIRDHLAKSLDRLQTTWIDLYYLHRINRNIPVEDVAAVMKKLKEEGLIREWGLSQVSKKTIERAHRICPVGAVQNLYNILERGCEDEVIPYCLEQGIAVVPFSPVASGYLSGKIRSENQIGKVDDVRSWVPQMRQENMNGNLPILEIIEEFADRKHATPAQISMAWMLKKYPNVIPIPGSKNMVRILENLGAAEVEFSDSEFEELEMRLNATPVFGHRGFEESIG